MAITPDTVIQVGYKMVTISRLRSGSWNPSVSNVGYSPIGRDQRWEGQDISYYCSSQI